MNSYAQKRAALSMAEALPHGLKGLLPAAVTERGFGLIGEPMFVPYGGLYVPVEVPAVNSWLVLPGGRESSWADSDAYARRMESAKKGAVPSRVYLPESCVALVHEYEVKSEVVAMEQVHCLLESEQCANNGLVLLVYGTRCKRVVAGCCTYVETKEGSQKVRVVVPLPPKLPSPVRYCLATASERNLFVRWCRGLCLLWALSNPRLGAMCAVWMSIDPERLAKSNGVVHVYCEHQMVLERCRWELVRYMGRPTQCTLEMVAESMHRLYHELPGF